jgi:hypothetical protein
MDQNNRLLKGLPPLEEILKSVKDGGNLRQSQDASVFEQYSQGKSFFPIPEPSEAPRSNDKILISTSPETTREIQLINSSIIPYEYCIDYVWEDNWNEQSKCVAQTSEQISCGLHYFAKAVKFENPWSQLVFCFYVPPNKPVPDAASLLAHMISHKLYEILRKMCLNLASSESNPKDYVDSIINSAHGYEIKEI